MSENIFDKALIGDEEWEKVKISRVNTRPNAKSSYGTGSYTASDTKALFDAQGELFRLKHNALVNYARAEEADRATAEALRVEAEKMRAAAEGSVEEDSEYYGGRALAEKERQDNENKREANDQVYTNNDHLRNMNEIYRQNQERTRQTSEEERISNEISREERFAQMETIVGDLDKALDAMLTTQELIIGGGDS